MADIERYPGGRIVIVDYDSSWPVQFEEERARLLDVMGTSALSVDHVGSTSVPGLAGKPVIDILVGVESLSLARNFCIERLQSLGYRWVSEYEQWLPDELLFRKGEPGPWTHHVHVTEPHSSRWEEFMVLRDFLRLDPEVAGAYGTLKKALAAVFEDDIAGFRGAKGPFLRKVMELARLNEGT